MVLALRALNQIKAQMWPTEQRFLHDDQRNTLFSKVVNTFDQCVRDQAIDVDLSAYLRDLYLPLAAWLMEKKTEQEKPLVIGICGGQGSGKSTSTALLATTLKEGFQCRVANLSIDDIYKTRAERKRLAEEVHPLFLTRGVPMTHDVRLGIDTIETLCHQGQEDSCSLPLFDKAIDDRADRSRWPLFKGKPDVIILEGWCVGAIAESEVSLGAPINSLERDEDPDGCWRRCVNSALQDEYQTLFAYLDVLMLLKVESMKKVFTWRRLQERKLAQKVAADPSPGSDIRVMSKKQVDRFIMHYERLTRHILQEMPERADIVLPIDDTHNPAAVRINQPII